MSILGDKLNQYIEESGYSVNKLATLSGVNRTSIVRMINANRLPEQHNIEKLLPYLKLTNDQKESLWRTYEIMSSGEYLYGRRQFMLKMMRDIYDPNFISKAAAKNRLDDEKPHTPLSSIKNYNILHGRYEVAHGMVLSILTQPDDDICVFAPFTNDFISGFFRHFTERKSSSLHIRHLTHFIKNPSKENGINYNLSILSHVLPLAFTDTIDYSIYYSYVTAPLTAESQVMLPYYIIVGECLILLSLDFEMAVFIRELEIVEEFRSNFNRLISESEKLVHTGPVFDDASENIVGALSEHFPPSNIRRSGFCKFGSQPWLFTLFEFDEIIETLNISDKQREYLFEVAKRHSENGKKIDEHICFFTEYGLRKFAEEGILLDFPKQITNPIDRTLRLTALERLKEDCLRHGYTIRIINEHSFPVNPHLSIQLTQENRIAITLVNYESNSFKIFFMNDPTTMDAFVDFLEYCATSPFLCADMVFSIDKTIEIIDDCIEIVRRLP